MIDTKTLSIKDKISLLNKLYEELSGHGIGGDTELAHINPWEADLLRSVGGAGTVNEVTGLSQYLGGGGGSPPPQPTQTTTRQVPEYAPEQREYIADIFGKSQELYEQRTAEGFQPFPGQQLAPFAAQEQEAFSGIESLARGPGAAPAFEIARTASLGAAAPITAAEIQQGMNPYQQAVTDIAKREAARQYARGPQAQLRTGAVESGGLRGARRFIEEAEGQRNLQQQMSDIQTMGSQQAYNQAMAEAAAARGRLANLATQMPSIGTGAYQQQLAQFGQLGGVGEAQRAQQQAAIDLAQSQFQREQMFPEETLATYLRFITNAPSPSGFQRDVVAPGVRGPSALTQIGSLAGGLGTLAGGLGGKSGLFGMKSGGAVPPASGRQAGLSGVVRRAQGGQIVRMQTGGNTGDYVGIYGDFERLSPEQLIQAYTPPTTPIGGDFGVNTTQIDKMYGGLTPKETEYSGLLIDEAAPEPDNLGETPSAPDVAPEKEQSLVERYAAYKKLMEGDEEETGLSWPERLQIASAFFSAADTPGTGSFTGDLAQFGAKVGPGAAKGLAARDARELAAKKRRIQSVKDFRQFVKEERLEPLEIAKLLVETNKTQAEIAAIMKTLNSPDIETKVDNQTIAAAQAYLNGRNATYDKTELKKGALPKIGTADHQLATLAATLKMTPSQAYQRADAAGAVFVDPKTGKTTIDVDMAITGKTSRPVEQVTKAEGGRVDDRPILRYPEDF